jgi:sugar lactone lactonase
LSDLLGQEFDRLLVTSAWKGLDGASHGADPHHGRTFILCVGAIGRPEPGVRLS